MLAASFCSASQLRKLFWLTNYLNSGINCTSLGVVKRETRIPCLAVTTICAVSHLLLCFMVLGGTKEKSQQTSFQSKANEWFWYLKLIDEELKATDGLYWVLLCFLRKWKHVTCFISPQREVGIADWFIRRTTLCSWYLPPTLWPQSWAWSWSHWVMLQ